MALTLDAFEGGQKRRFGYFSPRGSITLAAGHAWQRLRESE